MAHILFSQSSGLYYPDDHKASLLRLSIFIIAGGCGGVPALVWTLRVIWRKYEGRISAVVIMLLLSDLLELLLSPYVVTKLLQNDHCWDSSTICRFLTSLWSALLFNGLYLQQVMVLEGALTLRHPTCSAHAFSPFCSIIISIFMFLYFLLCEFSRTAPLLVFTLPLLLMITLMSCIVTCRTQNSTTPYRTRKPSYTALVFVTSTLVLHVCLTICAVVGYTMGWWMMNISLLSLRVIIDPLLCVLVYRKDLKAQTAEPSADIELTRIQSSASPDKRTAQEV